jgi:hypothetical protein
MTGACTGHAGADKRKTVKNLLFTKSAVVINNFYGTFASLFELNIII